MKLIFIAAFFVSMMAASSMALAYDVGVSPDKLYAGEVAAGTSKVISFSVLTTGNDNLVVTTAVNNATEEVLNALGNEMGWNYSSEGVSGWVELLENPVELLQDPSMAGSNIKAMKSISFLLTVPSDAEPGLHAVSLTPYPFTAGGLGNGASMVGSVYLNLGFDVQGYASYSGLILDATAARKSSGVEISPYFQNTGNVTEVVRLQNVDLFYSNGTLAASSGSGSSSLVPGEVRKFTAKLPDLPNGDYVASVYFGLRGSVIDKNITVQLNGLRPAATAPNGITGGVLVQEPSLWLQMLVIIFIIGAAGYYVKRKFFD